MKYFISAMDNNFSSLGIPAGYTERIIPAGRVQSAVHEKENDDTYISLPVLLKLKDSTAVHGLVLKSPHPAKTVLLVPRIDIELEIPEDKIHSLPEALAEQLVFFNGVYFIEEKLILILDPEKLIDHAANGNKL